MRMNLRMKFASLSGITSSLAITQQTGKRQIWLKHPCCCPTSWTLCFCPRLTFCWIASIQHFKTWCIFFAHGRLYMTCFSPQLTLQFLCSWRIFLQIYSNHAGIYLLIEEEHGASLLRSGCELLNLFLKSGERFCVQGLCLVCHGANRSHIFTLLVSIGMPSSPRDKGISSPPLLSTLWANH